MKSSQLILPLPRIVGVVRIAGAAALLTAVLPCSSSFAQFAAEGDASATVDAEAEPEAEGVAATEETKTVTLDEEPARELAPEAEAEAVAEEEAKAAAPPPKVLDPGTAGLQTSQGGLFDGLRGDNNYLGWDGGFEMDLGYARYSFSQATFGAETFNDFRGQAWFGPVFEHRFGADNKYFIRGTAEVVAWLRDEPGALYKVNVFDAYAMFGKKDVADLQVGRFNSWRMTTPGNGFDIFTLEDTGAMVNGPIEGGSFAPYRYEVNHIWLRSTPGRVAIHAYPLKPFIDGPFNNLGVEILGEYGKQGLDNVFGVRGALVYDTPYAKIYGGGEYRTRMKATEIVSADLTVCEQCNWAWDNGYGGGAVIRPPYVEVGVNYGNTHGATRTSQGNLELSGIRERNTLGGFLELHSGHLLDSRTPLAERGVWADQRSANIRKVTIGAGVYRTESLLGNSDFAQHVQKAAYVKYNLGFNEAYLKLVISQADATFDDNTGEPGVYITNTSKMVAGRLRFAYYF